MKISLPQVTLMGIDCVNVPRLQKALDISSHAIEFGAIKLLTSLDTTDPRKIEISSIKSIQAFSEFCIRDLYKYVDTEFVLLVQYDGFILHPQSWNPLFLEYDYIGAPWLVDQSYVRDYGFPIHLMGKWVVGNGGFCLRSKKFLEICAQLAQKDKFSVFHPEDVVLCVFYRDLLEQSGLRFAPVPLAMQFSIEDQNSTYKEQFGFHDPRRVYISKWIQKNPQWDLQQFFH